MPDKPNPIDNLIFDIITDEKDYSDRLYLDKKRYTVKMMNFFQQYLKLLIKNR